MSKKPVMLCIMDGFGWTPNETYGNAVAAANKPFIDSLMAKYPMTTIDASGMAVGLPDGQMGNSEVGHTNMGAGRIVYQQLTLITKSIRDGAMLKNPVLVKNMKAAIDAGKAIHLMGLVGTGGVHSHADQTHQMDGLTGLDGGLHVLDQHRVLEHLAVADGLGDEGELLVHDAACAHVGVANFGVAHLAIGQADGHAGSVDGGHGIFCHQSIEMGLLGGDHGVAEGLVRHPAEAIHDAQKNRFLCHKIESPLNLSRVAGKAKRPACGYSLRVHSTRTAAVKQISARLSAEKNGAAGR